MIENSWSFWKFASRQLTGSRSGLSALLLLIGALAMAPHGDFFHQGVQPAFWVGALLMGVGFVLTWDGSSIGRIQYWLVAIASRCILLGMTPGDDVWRYLWEGTVQIHGFSPFDFPPNASELGFLRTDWWNSINYPDVAAIYPPIAQLGFRLLAWIHPSVLLFKLSFVAADLAVCGVLARWFGVGRAIVYAWNPLVIYSFAGGGHFDSWFVLPIVLAWGIAERSRGAIRWMGCALLVGIAVAVKWVSLPLMGLVSWRAWRERNLGFALLVLLVGLLPMAIAAVPFCADGSCPLVPIRSSFVTSARSAQLLPYLVRSIWPHPLENWVYAPPLALATLVLIFRSRYFHAFAERYFIVLYALSPVIHIWYFTWAIPFAVLTRNWGLRLVSLSAFVYFLLPHRVFLSARSWLLTPSERICFWLPFVVGVAYSALKQENQGCQPSAQMADPQESLESL